jgi:Holliday junction resolvasome RuvABC endonuclease subunit
VKVLGIDPGLASLGLALVAIDGTTRRLLKAMTVHTAATSPFETRLDDLARETLTLLTDADLVCFEDQGDAWHGQAQEGRTSADGRKVQEVFGMLRGLAISCGRPRVVLRPQSIRAILGVGVRGAAGKKAVAFMVRRMVDAIPQEGRISQHAIDAIGTAVAGERHHHASLVVQTRLPGTERPKRRVRTYPSVKAARAAGALP